jgi:type IV secretory pathway TraG/TraD family ATPase VirD4
MLKSVKGGHRGLRYVEDASSKQAMSVFAVMMQYTKSFEYMSEADGSFSIDEWLDKKKGWIYVTNYPLIQDTLRPVLSLFIDLLGKKLLSQKDDYYRRVFFFLDEFGTLQRLSTIVRLLTLSRSKGGSIFIGIQDIGQIDKLYTEPLRQAIVNACSIHVVFSVADPKTAGFLSEKIGDTAYRKTDETHSMGAARHKDGISISEKDRQEKLVLPSEVMNLEDLSCYVQLPNYSLTKTHLAYKDYPCREEPFLVRESLLMSSRQNCETEFTGKEERAITEKDILTEESVSETEMSLDNISDKEKKDKMIFSLSEREFEV